MKKPTFSKAVYAVFILFLSFTSVAQTLKPFAIRKNVELRGKMLVIGNNILGKDNNPLNDNSVNESISMKYIDIDGDASTFSSSSADLLVPKKANGSPTTCYRITYAALYWGAMLQSGSRTNINKVKLKLPGGTTYNDVNGTVIYDAISTPIVPDNNTPYTCYADVTSLLSNLPSLAGTYTVADVVSSTGFNGSTGLSAGWTLFVIYEDPSLNMKSFTTFDGFSALYDGRTETIPVTGFRTPQSGNVDLQFAYAALDGDKPGNKSKLEFGTKEVSTPLRGPANNFFNSTIENSWGVSDPRNPSGSNTLGYDTGMLEVKGANPEYIKNNQTSTSFTLQVARGQADPVFAFFGAYAVDIIAPKIDLTKVVKNTSGTDIGGGNVNLAQSLVYEISYQSTGNDNVTNFTIKDVLPLNLVFDPATGIDYTNAGGATLQSYDAATRTLVFNIPSTSVEVNDGLYTIRLNVQVAPDCNSLATACSNEIKNQAFATYQGVINTDVVQEEGSYASTVCKLGAPESTNFIVDISNCTFTQNVILCGSSVVLKASNGYSNYSWSTSSTGSPVIGTGQTFTATQTGTYYVHNTAPLTCKDIVEQITVTYFGVTNTNPVIPYAQAPYRGNVVICPNNGKPLPNLFLCGANDSRLIKTGISDAASIVWEKLDEVTCPSTAIANCANENFASSCWKQVGTGPDYLANTAGQFRVTLNYTGGCFSQFYFNVYQNLLDPTFTKKDIICGTPGKITIGGVPTGYEFSLDGVNYQLNNPEFIITTAGNYTVYIKQQGVTTNPCIFQVPNILVNSRTMNVRTFIAQPSCNGINDGSVKLIAENVEPQYYFSIEQGGVLVNSSAGPIAANEYTFPNLSPGDYVVKVSTDDNCIYEDTVKIVNPPLLKVTANVTKPITCVDGEITINIEGGTPNYNYYVNGTDVLLNSALTSFAFPVSAAGRYDIKVDDLNNCPAVTSIDVSAIAPPVYTVGKTDVKCYGDNTGVISFNVANANGYTLAYSIDNGVTYLPGSLPTATFPNLAAGTYNTIVRYTLGTAVCYGTMEVITITQPSTALTASAGVSELAGCGPSGEGKIRITNPQGGTPFPAPNYYLYSFNNQATWVTSNEAYMAPGTYTVYIKDFNGCIYAMPNIIIEPEPVAPTIDVASPVFNCDGSANSTVTITNPGGANFEYGYLLDGNVNTNVPSNVFVNVPSGSHTVSVTYKLLTVPTYSNLLKEDFGSGLEVSSPGINTNFCFEKQNFLTCDKNGTLNNGEYTVTNTIKNAVYSGWHNPVDHTSGSATGRYLAVDAGYAIPNNAVLYRKTIKDIIPNQPIQVRFYATNLLKVGNGQPDASLTVELQNSTGTALSSSSTGAIPKTNGWVEYNRTIDPSNNTTLDFVLRLEVAQVNGIDFAVDDIEVYQLPKTCITKVDFPFVVPTGQAFSAAVTGFKNVTCAGANNGEITIAAQNFNSSYQYTIDGTNWTTVTTSPYTITGLLPAAYNVQIRYDATSTGTCVKTIPQTITAPTAVTVTATITKNATCITGATITAVGAGGTPAYQYELRESDGTTVVTAFTNNNGVFIDVPAGNYTVFVRDANLCISAVGAPVNVVVPAAPTATIVPSTAMCFDPLTGAQITVNISGGVGPYSYQTSTNGGSTYGVSSPTFAGPTFTYPATTTGTYMFKITDSNGCYDETLSQVINATVTANAVVTTGLDCDVAPANQAVITGTISGGTAPFTVVKTSGTGPGTLVQPTVTGNTFTYTTGVASAYTFEITDALGCKTPASATINSLVVVTGNAIVTNETCEALNNGNVTLEALTGVAPFTYNFNNLGFSGTVTYGSLSGSLAGTSYPYQIKDNKGCIYNGTAIVFEPTPITISASITTAYTCDGPATITASASGGNGSFTYTLNRNGSPVASNTTGIFNNLSVAGNYTVTVTDAKNCSVTSSPPMVISALNPPAAMTIGNSALTCPTNKATVTITNVMNSAGVLIMSGLEYRIVSPTATPFQSSNSFAGLDPGIIYTFEVRDANNCRYSKPYTITPLPVFTVALKSFVNETCLNAADGSAIFTASGLTIGTGYTYKIDSNSPVSFTAVGTSFDIPATGLSATSHTITVTNTTTTCFVSANVSILPSTALVLAQTALTHVTCKANGTAIINVSGGWGTYTYAVTGPAPSGSTITQNNSTFPNLLAGDYSFIVTDLKGCPISGTFTINDKVLPSATIAATSVYCAGGAGATLIVTPNTQTNYTYSINGGTPLTTGTFSGLTPGKYTIRVTDTATGCYIDLAEQTIASPVTASTTLLADLDCEVTPASPDASIQVTIANGYPDYTYKVNTTGAPFTGTVYTVGAGIKVFTYPAAAAGTYYFEITDSKGCTTIVSRTINALVKPDFTTTQVDVKCKTEATGSITVTGVPASGTYTYILTPTAPVGPVVTQTTNVFNNLKAGTYDVQVKDVKQCLSDAKTVTINEPLFGLTATANVTTPLTCGAGNVSQAATITVTIVLPGTPYSGVYPYRYSYNGQAPVTSNTYTTNTPGAVTVVVYDANGCPFTVPVSPVVDALNPPTALAFGPANTITCDPSQLDTDLTVTVTNGVAPFKFEITSTDAAVAPATPIATGVNAQAHTFTNLVPGTYFFKVTDANNCTITGQYKIDAVVPIQVSGSIVTNVTCNAGTDGVIKFTVSGNRASTYGYTLVGSVSGTIAGGTKVLDVITYSGLQGNETYTFTVTNNDTKCSASAAVSLSEPAAITPLSILAASKVFCTEVNSTIKVTATGGTAPLYYAVVKLGNTPVFPGDYNTTGVFTKDTSVDGLNYVAYVVDKNGNCPQNIPVNVVNDAAPTVDTPPAQCYTGSPFTITMSGNVFTGSSIQYGINGVYTTNPIKTISAAGSYNLTVKDDNGCISPVVVYDVNNQLTIGAILDKDLTCAFVPPFTSNDAQITLSAGGGTGTYTYEYKVGTGGTYLPVTGNVYKPTVDGDYYFRVTSGGCPAETTVPVTVTDKVDPEITAITQTQFIKCSGDETAAIKIDIDNAKGLAPFVFNVTQYSDLAHTAFVKDYGTQTTGLAAGFYVITVTDAKGCTDTDEIEIVGKDPIDFNLTKIDIQCAGGAYTLGSITVENVVGGTAPYKYFITNNFGDVIAPPNPYVTTGSEDYTFSSILNFGIYTINVVDANGCNFSRQIPMTSPPDDLEVIIDTAAPNCTDGTATITVKATPLGSNYTFGIVESNTPPFSSNMVSPNNGIDSHIFTGLTPGVTYAFVVHDGDTGCDFVNIADIPIPAASTLVPTITPHNVTCINEDDGYVAFSITGYDATATSIDYQVFAGLSNDAVSGILTYTIGDPFPVNYPALPALPAAQVGNLVPGQYYIVFTERGGVNDGCKMASSVFDIKESSIELSVTALPFKNENCTDLGIIIAEAKDGTAPYEYLVNTSGTVPDASTSGWQPSGTFNLAANLAGESYYVFAKDANGCIQAATSVILDKDPDPVFDLSVPIKCASEGNFVVDVLVTDPTPSMAPYAVSVNGGTFKSFTGLTYSATGLNSGTQTIVIQDKNGCPVTHTIDIVATPLAAAVVFKPLDCSASPAAIADATITVTISEGTRPYTYQAYKNNAVFGAPVTLGLTDVTFNYPVAEADYGTYKFLITDANSCPIETNDVIIEQIIPIFPASNPIQPLCNGGAGIIELSATGGRGPYKYNFNSLGFSDINIYSVTAGTYPYIVRDALGCEETGSAILGEPTAVVVGTPAVTPLTCGPGNIGQAAEVDLTLVGSGGSGTFLYSFDGSAFSTETKYIVDDTGSDQLGIAYAVQDENGCEAAGTIDIFKLNPPTNFDITQARPITCTDLTSNVTLSNFVNGVAPLTYQIISSTGSPIVDNGIDPIFVNLLPGDYVFQVKDANNCVKQLPFEITDVVKIDIVEQSNTGVTCFTATDGKASFFVSGFAATTTYHYEVDGAPVVIAGVSNFSAPTIDLTGLTAGPHTIEVFDNATNCSKLINFVIEAPTATLAITKIVTPLGCTTFGAVTITATGGWGNYEYSLTQPDATVLINNTGVFGGLTQAGLYNISVKDANGCVVTDSFNLLAPVNPTATIDVTSDYCYDGTNAATLVVNAASTSTFVVTPFEYSIDNGVTFQLSNTFNNLTPGSYDIVVKDAYGCKSIVPVNTVIEPQLFATVQNTKDISCTGVVDGTIKISAVGGDGSYTYTVAKDGGMPSAPIAFPAGLDAANYTVTGPGSYTFVVYDARSCSYTVANAIVMVDPTQVTYTATPTSPNCLAPQGNASNGSILVTLDATNDNPDYTYTIVRTVPAGFTKTQVNNGLFTGLTVGTYNVTVTSARGCATPQTVTINNPVAVVASASPSPFTCSATNTLNETIVTVRGTGGSGTGAVLDYTYSENGTNWKLTNTFKVFDTGVAQTLTYYVRDANGCIDDTQVLIAPFPKLISAVATYGPVMDCINNQQVMNVLITGGSNTPNPFTYQVYQDGVVLGGLGTVVGNSFTYNAPTAGHYYEFEIFDNNTGCSIKSIINDVPLFNKINVIASTAANAKCNLDANGAIEINVIGYTGAYTYEVFNGVTSVTSGSHDTTISNPFVIPFGLVAGTNYTVVVTETAYPRCTTTSNVVAITEPPVLDLSASITVVNQNCNNAGAVITVPIASVTGGTLGYTYAFVPAGTSPAGSFTPSNTKTIVTTQISPAFDAIDVWVQDANGCTDVQTVQISVDPMPIITAVVATQCPSATGTYDITVTASGFSPDLEYSLDINSWQLNNNVLTVTSPGNYTVTVRDANQCTATWAIPVTVLEPLQLRADLTTIPTCLSANGEVTLTASGGTIPASYEYSQDGTNYVAGNVFSGLTPSLTPYTFYVRDLVTTCVKSVSITITAPNTVIDFALSKTDVTCNGDSDGTITVNLTTPTLTVNNNPLYTYALNGTTVTATAVNVGPQNSPLFSGLPAGTYTVTVTSGLGCTATQTVSVVQPNPMVVPAPTVVPFGCTSGNTANFATITVNGVTGGSGSYLNYEFIKIGTPNTQVQFGSSNIYTEANLTGGSYIVNVYDSKGCMGTTAAPIVIDPFVELDKVNVVVNQAITCTNLEDITVSVTTIGGTPASLLYTLVDVDAATGTTGTLYPSQTNPTGIFTDLPVANYLITVTNPATGCIIEEVHYVNEPNTFDLTIDSIVDVICLGDANGSARVTLIDRVTSPTDEAGPFDYTVYDIANPLAPVIVVPTTNSPTFGPITLNGLRAGTYMISAALTNSPYCIVSKNFTITGPTAALVISETHTDITCVAGNNDGTITASATGGWSSDYEFELVGPVNVAYSAQTNFTGLTAGNYTVNVRDSKGCIATTTVNLSNPTPIVFTAAPSTTLLACYGDTSASITASVPTGGQGSNYMYTLNTTSLVPATSNGPQTSPTFNGLGAGTYTITVTDGYSCSATSSSITIVEPAEVIASLVVASSQTCLTQASLTLSATGGTGIYTYSADPTFASNLGTFTNSVTFQVPVGTYHYYVKDANGCVSVLSNDIEVLPLEALILNVDSSNAVINCKGDLTGVIVATAQGGLGNYVYTLLDGAGLPIVPAPTQVTPGDFTGLAAGFYKVRVDSGDCNTTTVSALEIKEPLTPISETHSVVNVTCFGEGNGQIIMTASGGTGIIKYAISPRMDQFFESGTFVNLEPGLYDVLAQDENGCYIYLTGIAIIEPSPLTASLTAGSLLPEICFGDNDGAFSVDISGGTMPYSVSLDDINGTYTTGIVGQTQFDFTGLAGGAHTVYVKDFNGCLYELIVDMPESVKIDPIATVDYGCVNNSASNSVTVTVDASITNPADVDYSLDGAPYQLGNVFTNVAPGVGHYIDVRHTNGCIQRTTTFDIAQIDPLAVILNDGGLNEIVATTTGGSGTYQYTFNGESTGTKNTFIYYKSGDYTVEVTDSNGCTVTATRYFEFIDIKIPNVFTPNGDGNNDGWTPTNTINYPDLVFHVFDRYGRKVGTFGEGQFWDGKYNGTELPTGDYWYVLKLKNDKDAREFVGHFTLYR
ncbi:T9SS type B sorting domain-containing protein [Flavobacterium maritimum]|uniref:T9SS type B sorting domain-containing protein n=1 Tax=Flavobacterium maritimum TaxID=3149042 RepID=UPI0032B3D6AB